MMNGDSDKFGMGKTPLPIFVNFFRSEGTVKSCPSGNYRALKWTD